MAELETLLKQAVDAHASDIFIMAGMPLTYKANGRMVHLDKEKIMPPQSEALVREIYAFGGRDMEQVLETGDDDFSVTVPNLSRFRISIYKQRGSLAAVIRVIPFGIPDYKTLQIPESVMAVAEKTKGLVLVTGPAGGGKSTTLACVIDRINQTREGHIITLEE
ncbi:MAG: Flp pilus assembly complex ATPase component TadA, partial [Peptococcaceae bacterium]|nr:Flp pilus assembly complex ATPase component TadA [Peptococcaceae bacterium]